MNPSVLTEESALFVDLRDVDARENIVHEYHPATRCCGGPVLAQDCPWERHSGMTASVIFDPEESLFKAWYMAGCYAPNRNHVQCLATSEDGVHWDKAPLRLHSALGSVENNIVIPADYHDGQAHWESMLKDPWDPDPARRYKALGWSSLDWDGPLSGIYTATSPDGKQWTPTPEPVFRHHPRPGTPDLGPVGDAQALMLDSRRRRAVAYLRGTDRSRMSSESADFIHWSPPKPFLYPLHDDETLYNNVGFVYGNQYLGFLTHFDRNAYQQTQTLRLLTSRDGDTWLRAPAATPLIGLGELAEWDRFQIMLTGAPPIQFRGELHIYYRGTNRRHAKIPREFEPRLSRDQDPSRMSIGLARIRVDGFASIGGSFDGGVLLTRPYVLQGDHLVVNHKSHHGQMQVELLDEAKQPVAGWTREDCVPLCADRIDEPVVWKHGRPLSALLGRPVRLRFLLWNARLYSYRTALASVECGE